MRLFLAIRFSNNMKTAIGSTITDLKQQGVTGNYTRPENLHLTLAFIGESTQVRRISETVKQVAFTPFTLQLGHGGHFRDLYWIGLKHSDALNQYVQDLRRALDDAGIDYDRKKFRPHITVVRRARTANEDSPITLHVPEAGMNVTRVSLMKSERIRGKLTYTEVAGFPAKEE